jgi:dynein heavy chain
MLSEGKIDKIQYEILTQTLSGLENPLDLPNPAAEWLPTTAWNKLCTQAKKDSSIAPAVNNFRENKLKWQQLYETEDGLVDEYFPGNDASLDGKWPSFTKLCVLKALRPDKLPVAVKEFVKE